MFKFFKRKKKLSEDEKYILSIYLNLDIKRLEEKIKDDPNHLRERHEIDLKILKKAMLTINCRKYLILQKNIGVDYNED